MVIDNERRFPLTTKTNKNSDHFTIHLDLEVSFKPQTEPRKEFFNFRNLQCQKVFKEKTDNNEKLRICFQTDESLEKQSNKSLATLNNIFHECFKKIRVNNKIRITEETRLMDEKLKLINEQKKQNDDTGEIQKKIDDIQKILIELTAKKNTEKVLKNFNALNGSDGDSLNSGVWKVKNKIFPKNQKSLPAAKKDVNGRLVTSKDEIKQLYSDTFSFRLRERPMKSGYEEIQQLTEDLCEERLKLTKNIKAPEWSLEDLEKALSQLKTNKARDPQGLANELFMKDTIGKDLKEALMDMLKKVKKETSLPEFLRHKNITAIPKKGDKQSLENERGITVGSVFNKILMNMVYNDIYDEVDSEMSSSNIGARKNKNVRNHTFLVHGIINEIVQKKKDADLLILDMRQCFDTLWRPSIINHLYESGVQNDHLNLIDEADRAHLVSVNTPVGLTERKDVENSILQGEKLASLKCSNSIDKIGKKSLAEESYHYKYREEIRIPELGFVDDILAVANCGCDSLELNTYLNTQANIQKLQLGVKKCHKMHIGKNKSVCPDLFVDNWELKTREDIAISVWDQEDTEGEPALLDEVVSEKYLGILLQNSGSCEKEIKARVGRGKNAAKAIIQILEEIIFGPYESMVFIVLRNSLFISTVLTNIESIYSLTNKEIEEIERCDESLLREKFSLHSKTSKEFLYLETGCLPLRWITIKRRLLFFHYLLNETQDELVNKFLWAQINTPLKSDWVHLIIKDLKTLEIRLIQ